MDDAQILAEMNNLQIRVDERQGKIERQAAIITKLEQSRKDMKTERQALLRVARAASNIECPNYPEYDWANGSEEYQVRRQQLREALKEVEHLL